MQTNQIDPEVATLPVEEKIKQYAEALQKNKVELVASRDTPTQVVEWVHSALPPEARAVAITGLIMMQNTMIDLITAHLKKLTEPSQ